MFNFIIYCCGIFKFSWRTFWAARNILDTLIVDFNIINKLNIILYGLISLWMASKYHQDKPLKIMEIISLKKKNKIKKIQVLEG